jgi:hypothetical protein
MGDEPKPVRCLCGREPGLYTSPRHEALYYACDDGRCGMSGVVASDSWADTAEEAAELWNRWVDRRGRPSHER